MSKLTNYLRIPSPDPAPVPPRVSISKAFVEKVAKIMCLDAGDSWVADDGAQDQYKSDALQAIKAINKALKS